MKHQRFPRANLTTLCTLAVVSAVIPLGTAGQEAEQAPRITIYRTWVAPKYTAVEGLVRIDPSLLGGAEKYTLNLRITDARTGESIHTDSWDAACPQVGGVAVAALERIRFAMPPALTYAVTVSVMPAGRAAAPRTDSLQVQSLPEAPLASDLILASEVGYVDSAQTGQWTLKRGKVGIRAASQLVVDPARPRVAYYLELYPSAAAALSGTATGTVLRADGRPLASFPLSKFSALAQPEPIAGSVSVEGLPPGSYRFAVSVQLPDTTLVREHPFTVLSPQLAGSGTGTVNAYLAGLGDEELALTFAPLVLWLSKSEGDAYQRLSAEGKRNFLTRQFGTQSPRPDEEETQLEQFLARSREVESKYREQAGRSGGQAGWQTDRGRVHMRAGAPATRINRPSPRQGNPYELWQYADHRHTVYLFMDETHLGHYRLVFSTDPLERVAPDWDDLKERNPEALEDMLRLGVNPVGRDGGSN